MSDNKKTDELLPHPFNVKVYDAVNWKTDVDAAFLKSIQDYGIRQPIVYARLSFDDGKSFGNYILSGHRRWEAAKKIGLQTVPANMWGNAVGLRDADSLSQAELYIIDANRQRVKSGVEIKKEVRELLRLEVPLAKARERAGKADPATKRHQGRSPQTSTKVSKQTGASRRSVAAVQKLEAAAAAGNAKAKSILDGDTPIAAVTKAYEEQVRPPKDPEAKMALDRHMAKARELTKLFANAEVSRSTKENHFHLMLRNLSEDTVKQLAEWVKDATGVKAA